MYIMAESYAYGITACDVPTERRATLESFRAKRSQWLSWLQTDEHHAIWDTLSSMVWADVRFQCLTQFAIDAERNERSNALHNPLMIEALLDGYVATQILAIRRLMDPSNISLVRLLKDIRGNFTLFMREHCVCFDGLPYDYEAVAKRDMAGRAGMGTFWSATAGPDAWGSSERAH
jgi:hypothetical protein